MTAEILDFPGNSDWDIEDRRWAAVIAWECVKKFGWTQERALEEANAAVTRYLKEQAEKARQTEQAAWAARVARDRQIEADCERQRVERAARQAKKAKKKAKPPPRENEGASQYDGYLKPYLAQIVADYQAGTSLGEIADRLGRNRVLSWCGLPPSTTSIGYVLNRAGVKLDQLERLHRARMTEMVKLRNDGRTLMEIGKVYGLTRERVRQIIEKAERIKARAKYVARPFINELPNNGRVIDMGGPRDVWIENDPWDDK
jgi:hypothetical protein